MMEDLKLYELANLRAQIDSVLAQTEGELTEDVANALDAWSVGWPAKVQDCVLWAHEISRNAEAVNVEMERLQAKRDALVNKHKWIVGYIARCLDAAGVNDGGGPLGSAKFVKNPPKVVQKIPLDDETLRNMAMAWPSLIKRTPEVFSLDREAIKQYMKDHEDPDLARYVGLQQDRRLALK